MNEHGAEARRPSRLRDKLETRARGTQLATRDVDHGPPHRLAAEVLAAAGMAEVVLEAAGMVVALAEAGGAEVVTLARGAEVVTLVAAEALRAVAPGDRVAREGAADAVGSARDGGADIVGAAGDGGGLVLLFANSSGG